MTQSNASFLSTNMPDPNNSVTAISLALGRTDNRAPNGNRQRAEYLLAELESLSNPYIVLERRGPHPQELTQIHERLFALGIRVTRDQAVTIYQVVLRARGFA